MNGITVNTPDDLITEIARSKDAVTLKIAPSFEDTSPITGAQNGKVVNGFGQNGINTMVSKSRIIMHVVPKDIYQTAIR